MNFLFFAKFIELQMVVYTLNEKFQTKPLFPFWKLFWIVKISKLFDMVELHQISNPYEIGYSQIVW